MFTPTRIILQGDQQLAAFFAKTMRGKLIALNMQLEASGQLMGHKHVFHPFPGVRVTMQSAGGINNVLVFAERPVRKEETESKDVRLRVRVTINGWPCTCRKEIKLITPDNQIVEDLPGFIKPVPFIWSEQEFLDEMYEFYITDIDGSYDFAGVDIDNTIKNHLCISAGNPIVDAATYNSPDDITYEYALFNYYFYNPAYSGYVRTNIIRSEYPISNYPYKIIQTPLYDIKEYAVDFTVWWVKHVVRKAILFSPCGRQFETHENLVNYDIATLPSGVPDIDGSGYQHWGWGTSTAPYDIEADPGTPYQGLCPPDDQYFFYMCYQRLEPGGDIQEWITSDAVGQVDPESFPPWTYRENRSYKIMVPESGYSVVHNTPNRDIDYSIVKAHPDYSGEYAYF